jgi:hypothetical protein
LKVESHLLDRGEFTFDDDPIAPVESGPQRLSESHDPQPTTAEMSPDDDDNDGHFGFYRGPDWKRHGSDSSETEHRHSFLLKVRELAGQALDP